VDPLTRRIITMVVLGAFICAIVIAAL